jgi:hypothetical protein
VRIAVQLLANLRRILKIAPHPAPSATGGDMRFFVADRLGRARHCPHISR